MAAGSAPYLLTARHTAWDSARVVPAGREGGGGGHGTGDMGGWGHLYHPHPAAHLYWTLRREGIVQGQARSRRSRPPHPTPPRGDPPPCSTFGGAQGGGRGHSLGGRSGDLPGGAIDVAGKQGSCSGSGCGGVGGGCCVVTGCGAEQGGSGKGKETMAQAQQTGPCPLPSPTAVPWPHGRRPTCDALPSGHRRVGRRRGHVLGNGRHLHAVERWAKESHPSSLCQDTGGVSGFPRSRASPSRGTRQRQTQRLSRGPHTPCREPLAV